MRSPLAFLAFAFFVSLVPIGAQAQWQLDGVALSTAANNQSYPTIVSDGAGGAIVTWHDQRSGTSNDIYAQRVNASGAPQWSADGVALCTVANTQQYPTIVSDGAGGAIVTWSDARNGVFYDIYTQRVNASGVPQWTADGVALCTAANNQYYPTIVSDGSGGAIVTWYDYRSGTSNDIYAQRVIASGAPQWTADGVALCTAASDQSYPTIVSDGSGGAIVTWYDYRSGTSNDIYAQRVIASGAPQWTADGVALCTAANDQYYPKIVSDGSGGAIVTWYDYRSGIADIYVRRVNASGAPQWTADGVALCTDANSQVLPTLVSDGAGGAIGTWQDYRSGTFSDIYARRVNASGAPQWTANGVALCTAADNQFTPTIVSDGAGGAIVTWYDYRSGTSGDIYAQRVNASGAPQWNFNGVGVCTAAFDQDYHNIVSDGAGGAIVTWSDARNGVTYDIYAQRVEFRYGEWGRPEPIIVSAADNPVDQGGKVIVRWEASQRDRFYDPVISHYSLWRSTDVIVSGALGTGSTGGSALTDPREITRDFSGAAIWEESTANGPEYWEWIANQSATYQSTYSFTAPTRQDSVAGDPAIHYFKVLAHESVSPQTRIWESGTVSTYSVDNLSPAAPLLLTALRVGSDVQLHWNRVRVPDLRDYSVYRATSSGVTPVPIHFLSSAEDTMLVDTSAPTSGLYYIVTACDVHENQSAPSNEASVGATTGVGNTPPITALTVLQNYPNPFAGSTEMEIGLPANTDVKVEVYDVAGRRMRTQTLAQQAKGWRKVPFDGRDDAGQALPSGVYFYRVTANGTTVTRKMVIAR